jgi:hypothetical protein
MSVSVHYVGIHYELHAYIGPGGRVAPSPFGGGCWATYPQVVARAPKAARFAVVQQLPLYEGERRVVPGTQADGPFLVWDLHELTGTGTVGVNLVGAPTPVWTGASLDGLIMKAVTLYDRP